MIRRFVFLLLFALVSWSGTPVRSQVAPADLVMVNGTVLTVDPQDSVKEVVVVAGGKIVAVGTNAEIRRLKASTPRLSTSTGARRRLASVDTHCHFSESNDQAESRRSHDQEHERCDRARACLGGEAQARRDGCAVSVGIEGQVGRASAHPRVRSRRKLRWVHPGVADAHDRVTTASPTRWR